MIDFMKRIYRRYLIGLVLGLAAILTSSVGIAYAITTDYLNLTGQGGYNSWIGYASGTDGLAPSYGYVSETSPCYQTGTWTLVHSPQGTSGYKQSFTVDISSIPMGTTITSIELSPCAAKWHDSIQTSKLALFYRYKSSFIGNWQESALGPEYSLTSTVYPNVANPSTIFTGLNYNRGIGSAMEIGAKHTSGLGGVGMTMYRVKIVWQW